MSPAEEKIFEEMCVAIENSCKNPIFVDGVEIEFYNIEEDVIEDDNEDEFDVTIVVFGFKNDNITFNNVDVVSII